jgi:hypothetical protein
MNTKLESFLFISVPKGSPFETLADNLSSDACLEQFDRRSNDDLARVTGDLYTGHAFLMPALTVVAACLRPDRMTVRSRRAVNFPIPCNLLH